MFAESPEVVPALVTVPSSDSSSDDSSDTSPPGDGSSPSTDGVAPTNGQLPVSLTLSNGKWDIYYHRQLNYIQNWPRRLDLYLSWIMVGHVLGN